MKKYLLASFLFFSTWASADTQLYPCFTTTANLLTCLISNYSIVWPLHQGGSGTALVNDGSGNLSWSTQPAGTVTSVTGTAPVTVVNPTTAPVVSMAKATGFVNGYLGSSDWATFNAKAPAFSTGNLTESGSSVLTIGGGTGAVVGAGTTIAVSRSDTATNGYLASADWATFNNKVSTTEAVNTTAPLTGGGDLSAPRTLAIPAATSLVDGYLAALDWTTFNAKVPTSETVGTTAPLLGGGDLSAPRTLSITQSGTTANGYLSSTDWNTFNNGVAGSVPSTRNINTTAPITGGGNLSADRTIAITQAATAANGYLSSTDWNVFNAKVSTSEAISTTAPLQGGGDLSAPRTFSITQAATLANGYLSSTDWNTFNTKVPTTEAINTTAPLTGGGDLSASRTLAITQAATAANGYLSSTDWNTFNTKASATLGNLGTTAINSDLTPASDAALGLGSNSKNWLDVLTYQLDLDVNALGTQKLSMVRASGGSSYTLTYPNAQGGAGTALINDGAGALSWTSVPPSTRNINTTAPITGGGNLSADRTIAITQAATAANGYLSSTDWNTFNNKAPTAAPTFTGTVTMSAYTAGVTTFSSSGVISSTAADAAVGTVGNTDVTVNGNTTTCPSFAEPSTAIRLTSFTPNLTGKYMIRVDGLSTGISNAAGGRVKVNITAISGGPSNTFSQEGSMDLNATALILPMSAWRVDNLTAGTPYTYGVEACGANSPGTITFHNTLPSSGVAIVAYRIN